MLSQSNTSTQPDLRSFVDISLVSMAVLFGGLVALASIWLWFDYQAEPTHSILAALSTNLLAKMPTWLRAYLGDEAHLMGLPLTGHTSAYWYMARAGGIIAYLLMWLSVVWGLLLSTKTTARMISLPLAYGLHEFVSIMAVIFAVLHSVVLLGDNYINFNILHLVFPFTAPYEPVWTGLGTVGFYLMTAMTASFYVRKQIGQKVWRKLHHLTFLTFGLVMTHGLMAGTDTPLPIIKLMYLGTGAGVLFSTYYRLFTLKAK